MTQVWVVNGEADCVPEPDSMCWEVLAVFATIEGAKHFVEEDQRDVFFGEPEADCGVTWSAPDPNGSVFGWSTGANERSNPAWMILPMEVRP
jgi:hypothetical protein